MSVTPQVYAKARAEIVLLFGLNADSLSPDQTLRIDCAVALRLALDDLQGRVVRGESVDVGRMLTASEALARLLPPAVLATPPSEQHGDPREEMFRIYMEMRTRGELNLKPDVIEGEHLTRISALEAENQRLRAALGAGSTALTPRGSTAIDPTESDIVPPGELGDCHARHVAGPDDPPPRSTAIIEAKANPPAAGAAPAKRTPKWDSTPNAAAWRNWHAAGGGGAHYDRWKNRNGV
jgi:hypothetical protein